MRGWYEASIYITLHAPEVMISLLSSPGVLEQVAILLPRQRRNHVSNARVANIRIC